LDDEHAQGTNSANENPEGGNTAPLLAEYDMSKKGVNSRVLTLAMPALVELLLVQLCTMMGTMMVGRLGPWAISAVGYCSQPKLLVQAVFIAMNTGSTALISRAKGEENKDLAHRILQQSILLSLVLSIIISIAGFAGSRSMVVFMGATEGYIIEAAAEYMQIQMIGFIFNALTLTITACLRGVGKTKESMVYNLIANIVNVILNYALVYGNWGFPEMGVAGSSWATVIGQTVAFAIAVVIILRKDDYLELKFKGFLKLDMPIINRMVRVGGPAMGEQFIIRAGMMIFTKTIAGLGSDAFATHQIANNLLTMTYNTGQAFGIAATTLMGQSLGRKDISAAKTYTLTCRRYGTMCSVLLAASFILFGKQLAMLFTTDTEIINQAAKMLLIVAFIQPLQTSQLIINGALRGAGDTMVVAVITFIGVLIIRPSLSIFSINVLGWGLTGAWTATAIDQAIRSMVSYFRFKSNRWTTIRV